ncbi:UDP-2,4-diacetamido-2,4,6-trideoxy-beta-L-altropyranose hydrolase [Vibrio metschnikovii]|uniref:UDP-2,4-diacetamido-2,4, 6-trideoxy-beta-L-altropyranose hydrolase n=1 Tax=Vibrio metschnikovii TaxID=28172 RepID=UPI002A535680|nr:UDP-2,4-diacetamido-2,4,6-trideoxy-beta-L-altropyranose hydrolase [Vibrio metschnikovii]EKO3743068.1 UDP-2,4-diacetamido-2,4,6-trideoxy-beta-L-altropyranose hydrolase [Vibrio metschnikovii]EKO3897643.1 UDP-2,4-diacetamido-2,4,6-trideoxy-beta-L-altropyranose hydrolase [Vibrio metschnikovii]EKO3913565.1 UDP-2,4-diacetamido-2,4,6-trideoxy-beta-L-altropyranose hydrolase [Vibrio metschnikovii]
MKVVFRVDASQYIGSGHVMRCLVLAEQLRAEHWDVKFSCLPQPGDLISLIEQKGFSVIRLTSPIQFHTPRFDGDYSVWLQRSEQEDAEDFIKNFSQMEWVVVDHYGIGNLWERQVKAKFNCHILSIDDLNRDHESDIILDQNLWPDLYQRYLKCRAKKLRGPTYALLRPRFRELKNNPPPKVNQVIAFFGGGDLTHECRKLLIAANQISYLPFKLKVVTGRQNSDYEELLGYQKSGSIDVIQFLDDFELELASSKYAIGASGVSNWERFCLNIPSTIVTVAENQRELSNHLSKQQYVSLLGDGALTTSEVYREELMRLVRYWDELLVYVPLEVDGLGATRVIAAMELIK